MNINKDLSNLMDRYLKNEANLIERHIFIFPLLINFNFRIQNISRTKMERIKKAAHLNKHLLIFHGA